MFVAVLSMSLGGFIVSLVLLISFAIDSTKSLECGGFVSKLGATIPQGDIQMVNGTDLNISCILNLSKAGGLNSSNLIFKNGKEEISADFIKVVNESTIELHMERPAPSKTQLFYCLLKDPNGQEKLVCMNAVIIGIAPQPPDDFYCISRNWDNLVCEFHPKDNNVPTDYQLKYTLEKQANSYSCDLKFNQKKNVWSCFWNNLTPSIYHRTSDEYIFHLNMTNKYGNKIVHYNWSNYENVIPDSPVDSKTQAITLHSALLTWRISNPMKFFPPGVDHRIRYKSEFDTSTWKIANTSVLSTTANTQFNFNLTDLEYAYAKYDICIQIKSTRAPDEENRWSDCKNITFRTQPDLPSQPPKTINGAFKSTVNENTRDIIIYWQQIPNTKINGPNFTYKVKVLENGCDIPEEPNKIDVSYAKFANLSLESEYNFIIVSSNDVGLSVNHSCVHVPKNSQLVKKPLTLSILSIQNNTYTLTWTKSRYAEKAQNYSMFWCKSDGRHESQCTGYLEWDVVPANTSEYSIHVKDNETYQFAISANTKSSTSGMRWDSDIPEVDEIDNITLYWIAGIFAWVFLMVAMFVVGRRLRGRYKTMTAIKVILPVGIEHTIIADKSNANKYNGKIEQNELKQMSKSTSSLDTEGYVRVGELSTSKAEMYAQNVLTKSTCNYVPNENVHVVSPRPGIFSIAEGCVTYNVNQTTNHPAENGLEETYAIRSNVINETGCGVILEKQLSGTGSSSMPTGYVAVSEINSKATAQSPNNIRSSTASLHAIKDMPTSNSSDRVSNTNRFSEDENSHPIEINLKLPNIRNERTWNYVPNGIVNIATPRPEIFTISEGYVKATDTGSLNNLAEVSIDPSYVSLGHADDDVQEEPPDREIASLPAGYVMVAENNGNAMALPSNTERSNGSDISTEELSTVNDNTVGKSCNTAEKNLESQKLRTVKNVRNYIPNGSIHIDSPRLENSATTRCVPQVVSEMSSNETENRTDKSYVSLGYAVNDRNNDDVEETPSTASSPVPIGYVRVANN